MGAHAVVQAAQAASKLTNVTFVPAGSEFSRQITNYLPYLLIIIRLQKTSQNALVSKNEGRGKHTPFCQRQRGGPPSKFTNSVWFINVSRAIFPLSGDV